MFPFDDVIMESAGTILTRIGVTVISYAWVIRLLKSRVTQLFFQQLVQAYNKENIKARHHWPFVKGINRWRVDSLYKRSVMQKAYSCRDVVKGFVYKFANEDYHHHGEFQKQNPLTCSAQFIHKFDWDQVLWEQPTREKMWIKSMKVTRSNQHDSAWLMCLHMYIAYRVPGPRV